MTASPTWPRLWPGISSEAGLVTQDTVTGLLRKNGLKDGYGVLAALEAGGYLEVLGPGGHPADSYFRERRRLGNEQIKLVYGLGYG